MSTFLGSWSEPPKTIHGAGEPDALTGAPALRPGAWPAPHFVSAMCAARRERGPLW